MLRNIVYYRLKPAIPRLLRRALRRRFASRIRLRTQDVWPIMPGSERTPQNWRGWPAGKQFAVVLTHDVEGPVGLDRCKDLARLEQDLGFTSSFNFIPEGSYRVPNELRAELTHLGFEVGVHDLRHDGRLYHSRRAFNRKAKQINRYLADWSAEGFRSGFMLHNLNWLHELNIRYDMSTFDTDPFEPQPEGRHTIFPFWVARPPAEKIPECSVGDGYVELPYTLPQDSTLFLLLREQSIDLWKRKIDWLARHGGMVLLNTHPDYIAFNGKDNQSWTYPARFYRELLDYIRATYRGAFWQPLPREVAAFVRASSASTALQSGRKTAKKRTATRKQKIWIDLDNTPHVPFFEPIIDELRARGYPLLVTARDAFQVCDLADNKKLAYTKVGRHYGKNPLLKVFGLVYRSVQLAPLVMREKPDLGISHGARSQLLLSRWLKIPTILIEDYEYCRFPRFMKPSWIIAPDVIADEALPLRNGHSRKYPGIKEDVYAWKMIPDPNLIAELNLRETDLIVTVRPPATEAHYHNPQSEALFDRFMERAAATAGVKVVLLPRNPRQGAEIHREHRDWFSQGKTVIPPRAIDGLNLLWHSDLVVSGGGTMNREAAALGVPVYSIFRGTIGAVDRHLRDEKRLVMIDSVEDVDQKIEFQKRDRQPLNHVTSQKVLMHIVDSIEEIASRSPTRA